MSSEKNIVKDDHVHTVFQLNLILLSFHVQFFIVLSCLISVSVNFSTFLVIGKTSPVTYQVLGHLKTCLVLTFGYVLLHDPFSWRNILGILIAVVGMVLYSYICSLEAQQKSVEVSPQQVPFCLNFNLC
jgi:solute carrier family 35, member E3